MLFLQFCQLFFLISFVCGGYGLLQVFLELFNLLLQVCRLLTGSRLKLSLVIDLLIVFPDAFGSGNEFVWRFGKLGFVDLAEDAIDAAI